LNDATNYINHDKQGTGSYIHLSYTFDASLTAMFMPLLFGKSVVIASKQSITVFEDNNLWKYAPYDFIKITPTHLQLLQHTLQNTSGDLLTGRLVIGGEALVPGHFDYLIQKEIDIEIINEYGPTEATVGCSTYNFYTVGDKEKIKDKIVIGNPIDNVQLFILDSDTDNLLPIGVVGEIYIGGDGLARGYLNQKELTEEKFIANPFKKQSGLRLYKTGDLARWLPDGTIEFLGRKDDQVKIRGYRIELGEIENMLLQSGLVSQAVVIVKDDSHRSNLLVGYVVPEGVFDQNDMVAYLKGRLPEYMIPNLWVELESLPLTTNSKIDKRALPDPDSTDLRRNRYVAPRTETEKTLACIWKELLHLEQIGIYDNFFELGGHSLLAMRLISAIRKELQVEVPIKDLFQFNTISDLNKYIEIQTSTYPQGKDITEFELLNI
jgi:acyl-CoA synthetase (AMP-forming)/AMP-acid ligase II/acyl carrier protein